MNNEYDLIFHLHNELIDAYNINMNLEKHINKLNNKINKLKEDKSKIIEYIKENTDNTNFIEVPSNELLDLIGTDDEK